ncbi:MAG TPA: hypothetical protein VHB48_07805 [Chitinophagaceae bacterium]|nr:hypothetical protein [Chitinophagaceae bacterium]
MINRNNYEEWFLLYADDELNQHQRAAVELFVKQNPDMAAELETFMQLKLQPEEAMVFPDKSSLFKTSDVEINISNYEEFFYLYIDRELSGPVMEKVEKFVLQHPQVQDEFTLLKQTVLQPEAITFGDKSVLYRKEERRPVFALYVRLAVAAALIAVAVLGWWLYPAGPVNPAGGPGVAINSTRQNASAGTPAKAGTSATRQDAAGTPLINQKTQQVNSSTAATRKAQQQNVTVQPQQQNISTQVGQQAGNNIAKNNAATAYTRQNTAVVLPLDTLKPVITTGREDNVVALVKVAPSSPVTTANIINIDREREQNSIVQAGNENDGAGMQVAYTVPYKVINTDDEDRSMYIGSLELNKDKVKGFLKRAGRIFGSRNKKDVD